MIDRDFEALTRAAQSSLAGRGVRGGGDVLARAHATSWIVRRIERYVERARRATSGQRMRSGFLVLAVAAFSHFVLSLPAPAHARSAWPIATPVVFAAVAIVAACAIRSNWRR